MSSRLFYTVLLNSRSICSKCRLRTFTPFILGRSFHQSVANNSAKDVWSLKNERVQRYLNNMRETVALKDLQSNDNEISTVVMSHLEVYIKRQIVELFDAYQKANQDIQELNKMREEYEGELANACDAEITELIERQIELESQTLPLLVPPERGDNNDVIMEITAGVGGQEAMLFSLDLFNMYQAYAGLKMWQFEPIVYEGSEMGGLRKASAILSGDEVYRFMKYEGGVHRVQRVPKTEKSGRMHTSTATVAVLPQPSEIEISLKKDDLKWDTFKASGSGGQHVNTTDSAVRVTHIPTGTVAECQTERSQIKNRELALKILRSRIYEKEMQEQQRKIKRQRKLQVGNAGRSEKIRTYNFPQDRVTDHRIGKNMHNIPSFLSGTDLEEMIDYLSQESMYERLEEVLDEFEGQQNGKRDAS